MPTIDTHCHATIELDALEIAVLRQILERVEALCTDLGSEARALRESLLAGLPEGHCRALLTRRALGRTH